jgi:hypothetical protein
MLPSVGAGRQAIAAGRAHSALAEPGVLLPGGWQFVVDVVHTGAVVSLRRLQVVVIGPRPLRLGRIFAKPSPEPAISSRAATPALPHPVAAVIHPPIAFPESFGIARRVLVLGPTRLDTAIPGSLPLRLPAVGLVKRRVGLPGIGAPAMSCPALGTVGVETTGVGTTGVGTTLPGVTLGETTAAERRTVLDRVATAPKLAVASL